MKRQPHAGPKLDLPSIERAGKERSLAACRNIMHLDDFEMLECAYDETTQRWHASFRVRCLGGPTTWRMRLVIRDRDGAVLGMKREVLA